MAPLRSLAAKLKGLPRRVLGSRVFTPEDNNAWSKRYATPVVPTKYDSMEEFRRVRLEEHWKYLRAYNRNTVLITMVGVGAVYYFWPATSKESSSKTTYPVRHPRLH